MIRYALRDLRRNLRRTLASTVGVALGIGLFSGVLFFVDGSAATMTQRALAPLALDIQRIVTAQPGDLNLTERIEGPSPLPAGRQVTIELVATNGSAAVANDVVVHAEPPEPLTYVAGSTRRDGAPIPDIEGGNPLSHGVAGFGLNVGRLPPGGSLTLTFEATAPEQLGSVEDLPRTATVSSRELPVPIGANAEPPLTLDQLLARIAAIPGVAAADGLGFVDLPPGSLSSGTAAVAGPVRLFAFDQRYLDHYPSIVVADGALDPRGAMVSVEAARSLGLTVGDTVQVRVPGLARPLALPVTGVVDLARAQPLFASRKAYKLEKFLYMPDDVVVSPEMFRDVVVPAFARARATVGTVTRSFPSVETDVLVDRASLRADPATAFRQTSAIADAMGAIAPDQGYLIDNISNTLAVAAADADAGRRMFLFLGLPGALLAAFLAAYAGAVLAATERREHATLRVRGAGREHLRTVVLTKAVVIALLGSLAGVALGFASATAILGADAVGQASTAALLRSSLLAAGAGFVVTAVALYLPARRSVRREVSEERRALRASRTPRWRRFGLDVALLAGAVAIETVAIRRGALDPPVGSVYEGVSISLPTGLLAAPLLVWLGGLLLCARAFVAIAAHVPVGAGRRFGSAVWGIARRGVRRRAGDLSGGIVGLGLVVALGVGLALFAATYNATKEDDARFSVGADLRITPSVLAAGRATAADAERFHVAGVTAVTPVVFDLENAVLIGPTNQKRKNLAAIDPATFAAVAPLPDEVFVDETAAGTIAALGEDPRGVLLDEETAEDLSVDVEDLVEIVLALGTKHETQARFRVAGLFERFPGAAAGANLVVDLARYRAATGIDAVDAFLAGAEDPSPAGLARAVAALQAGPGSRTPIHVDTTRTALDKDRSSLTALNVNGLVRLDSFFVLLMSAAAIAIFVFGLLLQRRGEYVALRAQGLRAGELRALVLVETAVVTACGLVAGVLVGTVTAVWSIRILRGLFVLDPQIAVTVARVLVLAALVALASLVSGLAATAMLRRLAPAEILREE